MHTFGRLPTLSLVHHIKRRAKQPVQQRRLARTLRPEHSYHIIPKTRIAETPS